MALTTQPRKGDLVDYQGCNQAIYRITGWQDNERKIANIKDIDTGKETCIIVRFADGSFNNLLTLVKP